MQVFDFDILAVSSITFFVCVISYFKSFAEYINMNGFDFGDTVALILGLLISTLGILACLGAYARRLSGVQRL